MSRSSRAPRSHSPGLARTLRELRERTQRETDFSRIASYFCDKVASSFELLDGSYPSNNQVMMHAVGAGIATALGQRVAVAELRLFRYRRTDFYHGTVEVDGHCAAGFYFSKVDRGLIICPRGGTTHFMRFRSVVMPSPDPRDRPN